VELSEEARKRSKKLFGNLMGHLQKVRSLTTSQTFGVVVVLCCCAVVSEPALKHTRCHPLPAPHPPLHNQAKTEVAQEQTSEKLQQRSLLLSKVSAAAAESSAIAAAASAAARGDLSTALNERRDCARDTQRLLAQLAIQTQEQHLRAAAACIATRATPKLFYKVLLPPTPPLPPPLLTIPRSPPPPPLPCSRLRTTRRLKRLWQHGGWWWWI